MRSPRIEYARRAVRWLGPTALLTLVPKCVLCVLTYTGVGVTLGLGGAEVCGAATKDPAAWAAGLAAFALVALILRQRLRLRTPG